MKIKRVAVMQPTYLPWCGYFALLDYVDEFVLLDNVQYSHRSWQQRNRIKGPDGAILLTVPVVSGSKRNEIKKVLIDNSSKPLLKHLKSMQHAYSNSGFYSEIISHIVPILRPPTLLLSDLNCVLIKEISKILAISTPMVKASDLGSVGVKEDLLRSICDQLGATEYVSPPGSHDYLDGSSAFKDGRVKLSYFNFVHPTYEQKFGSFISHLSVIDMLFNVGAKHSMELMRGGVNRPPIDELEN